MTEAQAEAKADNAVDDDAMKDNIQFSSKHNEGANVAEDHQNKHNSDASGSHADTSVAFPGFLHSGNTLPMHNAGTEPSENNESQYGGKSASNGESNGVAQIFGGVLNPVDTKQQQSQPGITGDRTEADAQGSVKAMQSSHVSVDSEASGGALASDNASLVPHLPGTSRNAVLRPGEGSEQATNPDVPTKTSNTPLDTIHVHEPADASSEGPSQPTKTDVSGKDFFRAPVTIKSDVEDGGDADSNPSSLSAGGVTYSNTSLPDENIPMNPNPQNTGSDATNSTSATASGPGFSTSSGAGTQGNIPFDSKASRNDYYHLVERYVMIIVLTTCVMM